MLTPPARESSGSVDLQPSATRKVAVEQRRDVLGVLWIRTATACTISLKVLAQLHKEAVIAAPVRGQQAALVPDPSTAH